MRERMPKTITLGLQMIIDKGGNGKGKRQRQ